MTLEPEQLHVIRCYERLPPLAGGMERHIAQLTAAQRAMGVRVTELFNSGEPAGESLQVWSRKRLHRVRPSLLRSALFYGTAALRKIDFSDGRTRVVHVHGDWPAFFLGSAFGRRIGAAAVAASLHEWMRASHQLYSIALRGCGPIFTTGLREAGILSNLTGKTVIHLPSAPADMFFSLPEAGTEGAEVILVGSLSVRKKLELVIDCAALRPNLTFAVFGEGPDRDRLETLARRRELNNIQFRGMAMADEIHSAMCNSRLFLNTASAEGSPTAALEAMACGLPVVLTPSNDYSAIVEQGLNGIVTASWDPQEIVSAIDSFLGDDERLARGRDAARKTAEAHRWPVKARTVTAAMIDALTARRARLD